MADNNCSSAQTFCNINGQLVKNNLNISFPDIGNKGSKITPEWKQQIINILKSIYNYGNAGTRNPSLAEINGLDAIVAKDRITAEDYNEVVRILNGTAVKQKTRILGTYFSDLENYINNYKLNADRCNTCNSGCNTTCQASAQCDDYCNSCNIVCDTNCESNDDGQACGMSCGVVESCGSCDRGLH